MKRIYSTITQNDMKYDIQYKNSVTLDTYIIYYKVKFTL